MTARKLDFMPAVEIHPPEYQLIRVQKSGMLIEPGPSTPSSGGGSDPYAQRELPDDVAQPVCDGAGKQAGEGQVEAYRWHIQEHSGTHIDAPLHCTQGWSADLIPAEQLVGPLVVVDIRARASTKSDAQLTPDDVKAWEQKHGPIAAGAVVALFSGWESRVNDARKFFGLDDKGGYHFPGFHVEAVQFLQEQRNIKGIATDTLSLDPGVSADFPVHHYWLNQSKWGLENVAGLGQLPAKGSTIVVGGPKIAGCTGGPSRVLALL